MAITIYRVCRRIYASLDGEGSNRVGGRWNSPGRPVVYMAQSVALAVLENLVHMSRQDYPTGYVVVAATVPDHVRILDYLSYLASTSSVSTRERKAWDRWLQSGESAVLRVPSAVVPGDWNYLINPQHLDFAQISTEPPVPIHFDERLFESK
jgi:RES domain-containing protein